MPLNCSITIDSWLPTLSSDLDNSTSSFRKVYLLVGIPATSDSCVLAILYPDGVLGVPLNTSIVMASCEPTLSSDSERTTLFFKKVNRLVWNPSKSLSCLLASTYPVGVAGSAPMVSMTFAFCEPTLSSVSDRIPASTYTSCTCLKLSVSSIP